MEFWHERALPLSPCKLQNSACFIWDKEIEGCSPLSKQIQQWKGFLKNQVVVIESGGPLADVKMLFLAFYRVRRALTGVRMDVVHICFFFTGNFRCYNCCGDKRHINEMRGKKVSVPCLLLLLFRLSLPSPKQMRKYAKTYSGYLFGQKSNSLGWSYCSIGG